MKANWKLGQYCVSQDNVWCSRPLFQSSPLSYTRPQHLVPRGKCSHIFSKSKEIRPYLKFPQFKGRAIERMGDSQKLMTLTQKSPVESETLAVGILKEMALKWFAETQTELILQNGRLPEWFHGFVMRKEAENLLRNKGIGHFLIRLSDRATGYILSYKGANRCRHFVIHRLKDGRYMIDGSNHTHKGLAALIDYYMTEAIQPFGEVLTEACSQYDGSDVYDHISFNPPDSSCSEEVEVKETTIRRPLHSRSQPRQQEPTAEWQRGRPPAVPPKSNKMATNKRLPSVENISSNSEDSDVTPFLASKMNLVFDEESQVEAKYGQVNKFKSKKPPVTVSDEGPAVWRTQTSSASSEKVDDRKSCHLQWEPNNAIYSLAVEPQPIYNEPFEPMTSTSAIDVVYTEVDTNQWRTGTSPSASDSYFTTIPVPAEHSCQASETKYTGLASGPSTPPRLSPNLNSRMKSSSPTHSAQKPGASQSFPTSLRPLPHPGDNSERLPYKTSLRGKDTTKSMENTYEQVPVAFAKRSQTKPDKDEMRKKWFSDWKCK
ncbi:SH2 domain-containing protein 7 [Pristis pectinata]|uniref:SH2 domain-containing protein 7 n=1 Tax=Pristis pectinata TaxID=685728 RepID=UPI00223D1FAB|nr:SH2 domain-containing protein 7 [Pristis pectinata]